MPVINVSGHDPSLRNWGIATGKFDTETLKLTITGLMVITHTDEDKKSVRVNSRDLKKGVTILEGVLPVAAESAACFAEIPVGSQSSRAATGYGMCICALSNIRFQHNNLFELTPTQVKEVTGLTKLATKKQMIEWATNKHPEAPWPTVKRHGKDVINASQAEHVADAVAAIYAGIASNEFQNMLQFIRQTKQFRA